MSKWRPLYPVGPRKQCQIFLGYRYLFTLRNTQPQWVSSDMCPQLSGCRTEETPVRVPGPGRKLWYGGRACHHVYTLLGQILLSSAVLSPSSAPFQLSPYIKKPCLLPVLVHDHRAISYPIFQCGDSCANRVYSISGGRHLFLYFGIELQTSLMLELWIGLGPQCAIKIIVSD